MTKETKRSRRVFYLLISPFIAFAAVMIFIIVANTAIALGSEWMPSLVRFIVAVAGFLALSTIVYLTLSLFDRDDDNDLTD